MAVNMLDRAPPFLRGAGEFPEQARVWERAVPSSPCRHSIVAILFPGRFVSLPFSVRRASACRHKSSIEPAQVRGMKHTSLLSVTAIPYPNINVYNRIFFVSPCSMPRELQEPAVARGRSNHLFISAAGGVVGTSLAKGSVISWRVRFSM